MSNDYYPPVGFYFKVSISGEPATAFKEVSGISMEMNTEEVDEGGDNDFQYRVPQRLKHPNLVLKRGLIAKDSALIKWCTASLSVGLNQQIATKSLTVELLDEGGEPLTSWNFVDAWPVNLAIADLDSMSNEIAIESLEFAYTYFTRAK